MQWNGKHKSSLTEKQIEHQRTICFQARYYRCNRKLMSLHFLSRWLFFFNIGAVTHQWSSFSPLLCITGKMLSWSILQHAFQALIIKHHCLSPSSAFFPASFTQRWNWVMVVQSGVWMWHVPLCRGQRGMKGFPWLADHHSYCCLLFSMKGTPAAVLAPTRCV